MTRAELETLAEAFYMVDGSDDKPLTAYIAGFLAGRDAAAEAARAWGWDEGNVGPAIAKKIKALGEE